VVCASRGSVEEHTATIAQARNIRRVIMNMPSLGVVSALDRSPISRFADYHIMTVFRRY
jgi:hypothetical protein